MVGGVCMLCCHLLSTLVTIRFFPSAAASSAVTSTLVQLPWLFPFFKVASMIASLEDLMRQSQSQAESLAHLQEVLAQELDGAKSPLAAPSAEDKSQHFAELDTAVGAKIAAIEEDVGSITAPLPTPRSESQDNVSCGHADTAENEEGAEQDAGTRSEAVKELKLLDRVADCTFTEVAFVLVHASPLV
ncbi:MAG: hypothetical protein ACPIOQ_31780, partial [Promethearchaeia archaeon]